MTYSWNVQHRERKRAYDRDYRRRKWVEARDRIFRRDSYRCVYCLSVLPSQQLTIDHKQALFSPPMLSGWNYRLRVIRDIQRRPDMFVTACSSCNRRKGVKSFDRFMSEMQPDRIPDWVTEETTTGEMNGACEIGREDGV